MRAFFVATLVLIMLTKVASAADMPFSREAAIKALGYEPEAVAPVCKPAPAVDGPTQIQSTEGRVRDYLIASGENAAARAACAGTSLAALSPFVKKGEMLQASVCIAAAEAAGSDITAHVSEMMASEHPDVVAAYADGVARALEPIRDACVASKEVWAKVAAQTMLFQNRAVALRGGRVCALWRLALDKELKAATTIGQSKGKAAGLSYFQSRAQAALDGAHHYCGDDSASSLIDANVGLTKMLIDSMSEK